MTWRIIEGDCVQAMAAMPEASVDAVVCDPPYGLEFMGKSWDRLGDAGRVSHSGFADKPGFKGFRLASYTGSGNLKCRRCGKWTYDHEGRKCECPTPDVDRGRQPRLMQEWHEAWAREALRVLKPGGHLLAFGGTRTYHRLACAIEDAGFEIRDCLAWMYGSGFPKSLDVSKAIDKAAGAEREIVGQSKSVGLALRPGPSTYVDGMGPDRTTATAPDVTAPATPEAERWQGWGTALKPAHEPIVLARKPLSGTVAGNVLAHGTGALNVDGCRIESGADHREKCESVVGLDSNRNGVAYGEWKGERESSWSPAGRWPANVLLDQEAAALLDEQTGSLPGGTPRTDEHGATGSGVTFVAGHGHAGFGDQGGGASRFFYVAKASSAERNAGLDGFEEKITDDGRAVPIDNAYLRGETTRRNSHPTVKPIELMRWLCRLITPPGGTVLDPFTGSGTTGCAAVLEGFQFVGIEREPEYAEIARARVGWWEQHPEGMELVKRLEFEAAREAVAATGQLGMFDEIA